MNLFDLFILAMGLSMDAFAMAVCSGLSMRKATVKKAMTVGLYFGFFQAAMPLIGYFIANWFADRVEAYDHWIAFALLCFLGGRMILGSFEKEGCADRVCPEGVCADRVCPGGKWPGGTETSLKPADMLPLAVATSIDALATGFYFAFLRVPIVPAISFIGATTFLLSAVGVKIGNIFGTRFKSKAELAGGVILILIGLKILLEHLGILLL